VLPSTGIVPQRNATRPQPVATGPKPKPIDGQKLARTLPMAVSTRRQIATLMRLTATRLRPTATGVRYTETTLPVIVSTRPQIATLMHLIATVPKPRVTGRLAYESGLLRIARRFHLVRDSLARTPTSGSQTESRPLPTANMPRLTATMMPPIVTSLGSIFTSEPRIEAKLPVTVNPLPWTGN
jgi:hypothetical protein